MRIPISSAILFLLLCLFACTVDPEDSFKSECACEEDTCERCEDAIAELDDRFYANYLADAEGWNRLIEAYHRQRMGQPAQTEVKPVIDIYLDMSWGMSPKIRAVEERSGLLTDLINIVAARQPNYFRLRDEKGQEIEPLPASIGGDIRSFIRDARNYGAQNNYAPLDVGLDTLVKNQDRQSILITDGELARTGVSAGSVDLTLAWAQVPFTQWLQEGNQIDFIASEVNDERLFFIVFTPRSLTDNPQNVIQTFLEATRNQQKQEQYTHLKFALNDYRLEVAKDGRPAAQSGLNSTFVDWVPDYSLQTNLEKGFQHIHIADEEAFKDYILDFQQGKFNEDFQSELNERNKIIYSLTFTNEFVNYQVADLKLEVRSLAQPLQEFIGYLKCTQSQRIPFEDEEGTQRTVWCNPSVSCQDTTACPALATLSPGRPLNEVFTLHEESAMAIDTNQFSSARIAIKPAKNFNQDNFWSTSVFKIDIFIQNVQYDEGRQNFDILKWPYKGRVNEGLSNSIRGAMQHLKPDNQLIFTYYITLGSPIY